MEKYYVLSISEDGDVYLNEYTKEKLEEELNEEGAETTFFNKIEEGNLMEAGTGSYIIKGQLVVPQNKEVVTKKELP